MEDEEAGEDASDDSDDGMRRQQKHKRASTIASAPRRQQKEKPLQLMERRFYTTVRQNETPREIARLHCVDVRSLIAVNKATHEDMLPSSKLWKGTTVQLPYESLDWTHPHQWIGAGVASAGVCGRIVQASLQRRPDGGADVRFRVRQQSSEKVVELGCEEVRKQISAWLHVTQPENDLLHMLSDRFDFWQFREPQEELIRALLGDCESVSSDVLCVASTGFGKSLLYQLPALCLHAWREQVVLVVSPLIALMEDQVAKLNRKGEVAAFLGSAQNDKTIEARARSGAFALVYLTPEKLFHDPSLLEELRGRLAFIAVDEAHCITEWGHDFRPEFKLLKQLRDPDCLLCPNVPIVAVTATADDNVRSYIRSLLRMGIDRPLEERTLPLYRDNLILQCVDRVSEKHSMALLTEKLQLFEPTIVYVSSQRKAEELKQTLTNHGFAVDCYHAGMMTEARRAAQESFMSNETVAIFATTAFGMGIDKKDVRNVIQCAVRQGPTAVACAHVCLMVCLPLTLRLPTPILCGSWSPPKSFESYLQEIGRAGRDGKPATCLMLTSEIDFTRWERPYFVKDRLHSMAPFVNSLEALRRYFHDTDRCRWMHLIGKAESAEDAEAQVSAFGPPEPQTCLI